MAMMRGRLPGPPLANLAGGLQAIHLGHLNVEKEQVVGFLFKRLENLQAVVRDIRAIAELLNTLRPTF